MRTVWALCSRTEKAAYTDVVKKELPTEERKPLATPAPGTPALMSPSPPDDAAAKPAKPANIPPPPPRKALDESRISEMLSEDANGGDKPEKSLRVVPMDAPSSRPKGSPPPPAPPPRKSPGLDERERAERARDERVRRR